MEQSVKKRESGLELLRIICMIMIIAHHYSVHGGWEFLDNSMTNVLVNNVIIVQILSLGGKLACHIFMIITGYFMIKSKINYKKIILLVLEMFFYSFGVAGIFHILKIGNLWGYLGTLFPIFWGNWFIKYYLLLYICSPLLNKLILNTDKKMLLNYTIFFIIIFSVIPTCTNFFGGAYTFSILDNFIIMYLVGAYIRLYPNKYFSNKKFNFFGCVICSVILVFSIIYVSKEYFNDIKLNRIPYLANDFSIITVLNAYFMFCLFKEIKFYSKFVNWIASSTLGIYLLHDNDIVRKYIWTIIYPNKLYLYSNNLILHAFLKISIVFVSCLIIDKIRIYIFEKPIKKLMKKIEVDKVK